MFVPSSNLVRTIFDDDPNKVRTRYEFGTAQIRQMSGQNMSLKKQLQFP